MEGCADEGPGLLVGGEGPLLCSAGCVIIGIGIEIEFWKEATAKSGSPTSQPAGARGMSGFQSVSHCSVGGGSGSHPSWLV